jgi:uncharacterized protein YggE
MNRKWLMVTGLVVLLGAIGLVGCSPESVALGQTPSDLQITLNSQQGIWTNGSGKVSAVPDVAVLRLGIEAQDASVAAAQSQAAQAMDAVMIALEDSGVAEKDIQTQYFSIHRVTRWDDRQAKEVVIGYRVTNIVTAKIRDIDNVGTVIDQVAVAGGDLTRIDSIGFSVEDPTPYREEARAKAVADAQAKAEQLAELAGVTLGKPTYISENTFVPAPIYRQDFIEMATAGAPMMETPISPGELEISLSVQLNYAILN